MKKTVSFIVAIFLMAQVGNAQNGLLDPSFGASGYVTTDFGFNFNMAFSVAIDNNGKIVAAGSTRTPDGDDLGSDFLLARYNEDGSLSPDFGNNGLVITDINGSSSDVATKVIIQPDGKILVAGRTHDSATFTNYAIAVVRYLSDGTLDAGFGIQGKSVIPYDSRDDYSYDVSMALQPDGKIVVSGSTYMHSEPYSHDLYMTIRLTGEGQIDPTFGGNGKVITSLGPGLSGNPGAVVVQPDGKIAVGGSVEGPFQAFVDFAMVRYEPTGALDQSFGNNGIVFTPVGEGAGIDGIEDMAVLPDGKILAAGNAILPNGWERGAIVKYNPDGSLDNSFGTQGIVLTDVNSYNASVYGIAVKADSSIIICGSNLDLQTGGYDLFVAKYAPDGGFPSVNFGFNNTAITDVSFLDFCGAVAIQPNGNIIVAGFTGDEFHQDFIVARYLDDVVNGKPEIDHENAPQIFPNPVSDILKISVKDNQDLSVVIQNMDGKEVYSSRLGSSFNQFDLGCLRSGVYLILFKKRGETVFYRRMIKISD